MSVMLYFKDLLCFVINSCHLLNIAGHRFHYNQIEIHSPGLDMIYHINILTVKKEVI